jgi:L-histidine N-alpha-methyltransferase
VLGTDLVKDRSRLVAAYNDASGVTASFNRNVLRVLNRELGANFDVDAFSHIARFDEGHQWIEMLLRARSAQRVSIPGLGIEITFEEGEDLRTEVSAKFTPASIARELDRDGFVVDHQFGVSRGEFLLTLSHPYC